MASEQPQAQDRAQLGKAVEALNRHFSSMRTDLKFSVDEALNRIIVTVVDAQDGTVLRQIPNEDVLRIARMLEDSPTHLIETQA